MKRFPQGYSRSPRFFHSIKFNVIEMEEKNCYLSSVRVREVYAKVEIINITSRSFYFFERVLATFEGFIDFFLHHITQKNICPLHHSLIYLFTNNSHRMNEKNRNLLSVKYNAAT